MTPCSCDLDGDPGHHHPLGYRILRWPAWKFPEYQLVCTLCSPQAVPASKLDDQQRSVPGASLIPGMQGKQTCSRRAAARD